MLLTTNASSINKINKGMAMCKHISFSAFRNKTQEDSREPQ